MRALLGKIYSVEINVASTARTARSDKFFGCEGESSCDTISWVCGTMKTTDDSGQY